MKRFMLLVMALAVCAAGCSTVTYGRKFDTARVTEIKKGQTTKQELVAMLGQPTGTERDQSGTERLTYSYGELKSKADPRMFIPIVGLFFMGGSGEQEQTTLIATLKSNVVQDYSFSEGTAGTVLK